MTATESFAPAPYQLSGSGGNAWLTFPVGVASGAAAAFVYAWVNVYSPIAGYVSVLFSIGLAFAAIWPVAIAGKKLKVRSVATMRLAGATTGLATLYFAWAFFTWVFLFRYAADGPPDILDVVAHPANLWQFINAINADGWFSLGSSLTPNGALLWALWAIEAAIVIGGCVMFAPTKVQGRAFCEDCKAWMQDEEAIAIPADEGTPGKKLRKGGLEALGEFQPPAAGAARWLVLQRQRCAGCSSSVWSADEVHTVKSGKETKTTTTPVVPLSWQAETDAPQFERIAGDLAAANTAHFEAAKQKRSGSVEAS